MKSPYKSQKPPYRHLEDSTHHDEVPNIVTSQMNRQHSIGRVDGGCTKMPRQRGGKLCKKRGPVPRIIIEHLDLGWLDSVDLLWPYGPNTRILIALERHL